MLTSGDGGVFPRGLPVGTVVRGLDGGWHVALDSDAAPIDYVQILLFTDFAQLANEQALATEGTADRDDRGAEPLDRAADHRRADARQAGRPSRRPPSSPRRRRCNRRQ